MKKLTAVFFFCILSQQIILSQTDNFSIEEYSNFLNANKNLTYTQLEQMHSTGLFLKNVADSPNDPLYLDSIKIKYGLTDYEIGLLNNHGFMVTERGENVPFAKHFLDIYEKDLPVFISTDAILYAFHLSFDRIFKQVELNSLIPTLQNLLSKLNSNISVLESKYSDIPEMGKYIKDVDIYLSVARKLLTQTETAHYSENQATVDELVDYVNSFEFKSIKFFSSVSRDIDFSQFKPRGHYTDLNYPILADYFKTLMWLGRMELYLLPPISLAPPTQEDVSRQIIMSFLISELINSDNAKSSYVEMESALNFIVGEQDNVTLDKINELSEELNIQSTSELLDTNSTKTFQNLLKTKSYAFQRIMSQILFTDPFTLDDIVPASSFLLFGQRFIVDSYVTGNVVYDKIDFHGSKIKRMLPNTLDVLFSIGNDAALQLLKKELDEYKYSSNLAALRYLIDAYNDDDWNSTIYNAWLNGIRKLNPPQERENLPQFMQTAAWWQEKMNTQLASWSELRHDYILYAKQSYTGGVSCAYPFAYLEPIPEFYKNMKQLSTKCSEIFGQLSYNNSNYANYLKEFFENSNSIYDTLQTIAEKELNNESLTETEIVFLKSVMYDGQMCGLKFDGWYSDLVFSAGEYMDGFEESEFSVADYHTAPTDESANIVGWVNHAGTGHPDLAVVIVENQLGEPTAFIGPVMSFHEITTTNFYRLTDEEWEQSYLQTSTRPDWVNLYLANESGESRGTGSTLLTGIENKENPLTVKQYLTAINYPNPFNPSTIINFRIPANLTNEFTTLAVYNINGEKVKDLISENLPSGNYMTKWEGTNNSNGSVASGVYLYRLNCGPSAVSGKMILLR